MPQLNLLLFPLIGGYFFLSQLNCTKYTLKRQSGYELAFSSMAAGVFLLGFGEIIYLCLLNLQQEYTFIADSINWWRINVRFQYSGVAIISFLLGFVLPQPLNWIFFDESKYLSRAIREEGENFEQILEKSIKRTKMVSITLKNNKVYIGIATSNYLPGGNRRYLKIIPFYSGYRDQDNLNLIITTNYAKVYDKIEEGKLEDLDIDDDFEFIISVSEIVSINIFDVAAFDHFQESEIVETDK
jgi:hypothetical protein